MKKIANYLIALAIAAFTFTSCEDVPSPFGTVVQPDSGDEVVIEPQGSGTKSDPYNVAGALEFISGLGADVPSDKEIYVKGFVTSIKEQFSAQYGNAQFTMSDTKEGANTFTFFRGLYLGNKKWVEGDLLLAEGDEVIICGKVVNYKGNTPETVQNAAYTYSINGKSEGGGSDTPTSDLGTKDAPITVAKALEAISKLADNGETSTEAYVKGKISKVQSYSSQYKSITYYISDDGKEANQLQIYSGKNIGGAEFASKDDLAAGDEVVVKGKLKKFVKDGTATPEMNQPNEIITITKGSGGGGGDTPSGDVKKVTVQEFLAAAESTDVWYELTGTIEHLEDGTYKSSTQYGNFDLVDETGKVYVYGVLAEKGGQKGQFATLMADKGIKDGCKITIIGNRGSFKGDAQVANAYFVKVEAGSSGGSGGGQGGGESSSLLTNGDFETWADGQPTGWKSASSASSATLAQSTDAHGGKYSCNVNGGGTQNKRLASKEITLAAGSYNFSFWVKATTEDKAQVRPGYAIVEGGTINSSSGYKYGSYADISTGWKQVSYDFTLDAETTVCLLVMNPKANDYSSGKDVLVDDATLTKK
jgi:hypothetical protein